MRLTEEHKQELLEDARDSKRREDLARLREREVISPRDYVQFLGDVVPLLLPASPEVALIEGEDFRL